MDRPNACTVSCKCAVAVELGGMCDHSMQLSVLNKVAGLKGCKSVSLAYSANRAVDGTNGIKTMVEIMVIEATAYNENSTHPAVSTLHKHHHIRM